MPNLNNKMNYKNTLQDNQYELENEMKLIATGSGSKLY